MGFLKGLDPQQLLSFANIFYWQIAFGIVVFFLIFKSVFAKTLLSLINWILKKKDKASDGALYKTLKTFIFSVGIYLASLILPLSEKISYLITELFKIGCILFVTKIITLIIDKNSVIFKKFFANSKNESVNSLLCKLIRGIVWILSFLVIFKELGFDLTGLVAGLGVGSVIISFAAQDTVKSLMSGVTILSEKPFEIGDWVKVGDYSGSVQDITFKSTRIKAADNTIITIPNSKVTEDFVINWKNLKSRRFDCVLNVTLETSADDIKRLIDRIYFVLRQNEKIDPDSVQVHFDNISACSSDIKIFLYIKESEYIKYLEAKEEIFFELIRIVDKENIDLAYPTQKLYVENNN